jgi:hypothetical protein
VCYAMCLLVLSFYGEPCHAKNKSKRQRQGEISFL